MIDIDKAIDLYTGKFYSKQVLFLSTLAHRLTIDARATYGEVDHIVEQPAQLRKINELMHRLLGQQLKVIVGNLDRYPDDLFIRMIFEGASECGFGEIFSDRIEESFDFCEIN